MVPPVSVPARRWLIAVALLSLASACTTPAAAGSSPPAAATAADPGAPGRGNPNSNGPFALPQKGPAKLNLVLKHYGSPGDANLGALSGKVVVVDFWATWCGPCHEAARAYERLYNAYRAKGLEVYGVSFDENDDLVADFVHEQGVTYPILLDPSGQVSAPRFDIDSIPVTVIADKAGTVRFTHRGFEPASEEQVKHEVEQLLAEP